MKKVYSVEEYIETHEHFSDGLKVLRDIMNSTELEETLKWGAPTYCSNGKNIVGLGAFKHHFGVWFFQGIFLKDNQNLLINAQEGKTKALRQMRFESKLEINKDVVLAYVKEAIENQRKGLELKPERKTESVVIPKILETFLHKNESVKKAFKSLTLGKQREYCDYISSAKRETTQLARLDKIQPMILAGKGLYDKYKNC